MMTSTRSIYLVNVTDTIYTLRDRNVTDTCINHATGIIEGSGLRYASFTFHRSDALFSLSLCVSISILVDVGLYHETCRHALHVMILVTAVYETKLQPRSWSWFLNYFHWLSVVVLVVKSWRTIGRASSGCEDHTARAERLLGVRTPNSIRKYFSLRKKNVHVYNTTLDLCIVNLLLQLKLSKVSSHFSRHPQSKMCSRSCHARSAYIRWIEYRCTPVFRSGG